MVSHDRRSGRERRNSKRYAVSVDVEWVTSNERKTGALSDVSIGGCFVLCPGEVEDGDAVRILIPLADGMKVQFNGTVANHVVEIGFGVKFDPITPEQREILANLVRAAESA